MNVAIGKYNIGTDEKFPNEKEAISFVKSKFPELSTEEIRPYVKPLISKSDERILAKKGSSEGNKRDA